MPSVQLIVSQELRSMGDALRDLDSKQLIQSDFILMSGDVISNLNLVPILEEHRNRKLSDKNSIMTLILKPSGINHPSRLYILALILLDRNWKKVFSFWMQNPTNVFVMNLFLDIHQRLIFLLCLHSLNCILKLWCEMI